MNSIKSFVKGQQLFTFYVLAFALFWAAMPLSAIDPGVPIYFGILALTVSAIAVTGIAEGWAGIKALLGRVVRWRVAPGWYAVAVGLPILLGLGVAGASVLLGSSIQIDSWGRVPLLVLVLSVVAVGEEIAWRGFALPRLLAHSSALSSSVVLGVLWAGFHLPVFLPGMPFHTLSFPAFLLTAIGYSVVLTWLYRHTRGSVLISSVFHGAINSAGALYFGVEIARWEWLQAGLYGIAALLLTLMLGAELSHRRAARTDAMRSETAMVP